jgi:hypothetical protein
MFIAQVMDLVARVDDAFATDRDQMPGIMFGEPRKHALGLCVVDHCSMEIWPAVKRHVKSLMPSLRRAQAFDFGTVRMAQRGNDYALPRLDAAAVDTFNSGLIRLPFPVCWLEYDVPPDRRIGLLVEDKGDFVQVGQFSLDLALVENGKSGRRVYDLPSHAIRCRQPGRHPEGSGGWRVSDEGLFYSVDDPLGAVERGTEHEITEEVLEKGGVVRDTAEDGLFFAYLAMVLQSREKTVEVVKPSVFANRRRSDKRLHPEPIYRRITMSAGWAPGPAGSFVDEAPGGEGKATCF